MRSLPYWESREPIPRADEPPSWDRRDARYQRSQQAWNVQDKLMPLLKNMHAMNPDHIHEELELENMDFSSYNLEWLASVPRWRDYYLSHDQAPHYAYMKTALKALTWLHGPSRWILKCPQHMEQLPTLLATFADATVVITHRDPVAVIASTATMLSYGDRIRRLQVNPRETAHYWLARIDMLLRACVRDRDSLPAHQVIDVRFDELMANETDIIEKIYAMADLPMTEAAKQAFRSYTEANPRGKHGQVVYDLQADFDLDPQMVREQFAFYLDRFNIPVRDRR